MRVLVIWASPNLDGLTATSVGQVVKGLESGGVEVETAHLNPMELQHCRACGNGWGLCVRESRCVMEDDFMPLYEKVLTADGIVLVTAVYWHDMAECMKAFVDRMRRCESSSLHRLRGKQGLIVACAGGTGLGAVQCLVQMEAALHHMGMGAVDRLPVIRFSREYMLPALEGAGARFAAFLCSGEKPTYTR